MCIHITNMYTMSFCRVYSFTLVYMPGIMYNVYRQSKMYTMFLCLVYIMKHVYMPNIMYNVYRLCIVMYTLYMVMYTVLYTTTSCSV